MRQPNWDELIDRIREQSARIHETDAEERRLIDPAMILDEGNDDIVCAEVAANIFECDVTMRDTRHVTCLVYGGELKRGMSCDWAHAE